MVIMFVVGKETDLLRTTNSLIFVLTHNLSRSFCSPVVLHLLIDKHLYMAIMLLSSVAILCYEP